MSGPSFFSAKMVETPVTEEQIETAGDYLFWLHVNADEQTVFPDWHLTQFVVAYRTRGQIVAAGLQRELYDGSTPIGDLL